MTGQAHRRIACSGGWLRELELWNSCRLSCHHLSRTACYVVYRGCCAGRSRRSVPRLKPVGNGAYIVTVPRPSTRLCLTSRRQLLPTRNADRHPHDIATDCVDRSAHVRLPQRVLSDEQSRQSTRAERVSSFLTEHQHNVGYTVPC